MPLAYSKNKQHIYKWVAANREKLNEYKRVYYRTEDKIQYKRNYYLKMKLVGNLKYLPFFYSDVIIL